MDQKLFIDKMKTSKPMTKEQIMKIIINHVNSNMDDGNPRGHRNLIIVMEELAELTQETSKVIREKSNFITLLEEMADALLSIYYLQEIVGISDEELDKAVAVKMNRINDSLVEKGKYK